MKKLMIATAIVCAAAMSQAAQVDWQLNTKNTMRDQTGAEGTWSVKNVYLVLATAGDAYDTLKAGLADGTINAGNITEQSLYLGTGTTGSGKSVGKIAAISSIDSASLTSGTFYDLVYVAFDTQAGQDYYYISNGTQGQAWKDGTETTQGLAQKASWDTYSDNWAPVSAAPEPTSGLLLLLGVAGLALKRKRV